MRMRTAWPIFLAMGCNDGGPGTTDDSDTTEQVDSTDTPSETDTVDTDIVPVDPTVSATWGNIVVLHSNQGLGDPPRTKLRALFTYEAADVVSMAACVIHERYCMTELPTAVDAPVDIVDADFTEIGADAVDVGETLQVGTGTLTKFVRQSGTRWFYLADLPSYPVEPIGAWTATLGGDWGVFHDDVLDLPRPLTVLAPDPHDTFAFQPGNSLTFTWVPTLEETDPADAMYLIVELPPLVRRIWKLDDSGAFTLRSADLGDVTQQAIGTVELVRMTEKTTDWGGNTLVGQVFSRQTWNASTVARSCKSVLATNPAAPSGPYMLQPDITSPPQQVYCDMTTDGGGWTLVASANGGLDDMGVAYNADLGGLTPTSNMGGVWNQAAAILTSDRSDIRFACRNRAGGAAFDVDLSFYDNIWFHEMATAATDDLSCFNESDGLGADPPPERKNNLNGNTLAAGNAWNAGYLEGEDYCGDNGDFTVDFDDRGMDSNQADGTDWGEDDGSLKCGSSSGAEFFIFMREP